MRKLTRPSFLLEFLAHNYFGLLSSFHTKDMYPSSGSSDRLTTLAVVQPIRKLETCCIRRPDDLFYLVSRDHYFIENVIFTLFS